MAGFNPNWIQGQYEDKKYRGGRTISPPNETQLSPLVNEKKSMNMEINYLMNFICNDMHDPVKELQDFAEAKASKRTVDPEV